VIIALFVIINFDVDRSLTLFRLTVGYYTYSKFSYYIDIFSLYFIYVIENLLIGVSYL
jgi:hypothetical protein